MLFVPDAHALDGATLQALRTLAAAPIPVHTLLVTEHEGDAPPGLTRVADVRGVAARRFDARPGTAYLLRPDQHVAARWRRFDADAVRTALARATCNA
jgi:3-(3-hydroxy-phenyl)propionate hydroxylase